MSESHSREDWIKYGEQLRLEKAERIKRAKKWKFDTIATRGLYDFNEAMRNHGSILEPVYLSPAQTYYDSIELELSLSYDLPAWMYTRIENPSIEYLADTIALLEGYGSDRETSCLVTSSGMSAIKTATEPFLVDDPSLPDPNIVAPIKCYGGTFQLFSARYMKERGIEVRWVKNSLDLNEWESLVDEKTRFVYGEFPSNPAVVVFDMEKVAEIAHEHGVPFMVDATCASPALTRPMSFGADIVVQSVSKVMSSTGSTIVGSLTSRKNIPSRVGPDKMKEDFAAWCHLLPFRDAGPALHPMGAILTLNDLRTLRMRVAQMSEGAQKTAEFLESHPKIEKVYYPGLKSYEGHEIANKYMTLVDTNRNLYGYMLAFDVKEKNEGSTINVRRFFDSLDLIWRATDLGRVKTIATLPSISTHQQQGEKVREIAGISPSCVRLSIGIEDVDDLIEDLDNALSKI